LVVDYNSYAFQALRPSSGLKLKTINHDILNEHAISNSGSQKIPTGKVLGRGLWLCSQGLSPANQKKREASEAMHTQATLSFTLHAELQLQVGGSTGWPGVAGGVSHPPRTRAAAAVVSTL
jgi:hypothetical protein